MLGRLSINNLNEINATRHHNSIARLVTGATISNAMQSPRPILTQFRLEDHNKESTQPIRALPTALLISRLLGF
jgi:hypothetical protein